MRYKTKGTRTPCARRVGICNPDEWIKIYNVQIYFGNIKISFLPLIFHIHYDSGNFNLKIFWK